MLLVILQKRITFTILLESQLKQLEQVVSVGQLNLGWHTPHKLHVPCSLSVTVLWNEPNNRFNKSDAKMWQHFMIA